MGEMADFALNEVFDYEDWRTDYGRGLLSIEEAIDKGVIDEQGYEYSPCAKPKKTCRCCGESGLRWGKIKDRFVLMRGNDIHNCKVNPIDLKDQQCAD